MERSEPLARQASTSVREESLSALYLFAWPAICFVAAVLLSR